MGVFFIGVGETGAASASLEWGSLPYADEKHPGFLPTCPHVTLPLISDRSFLSGGQIVDARTHARTHAHTHTHTHTHTD